MTQHDSYRRAARRFRLGLILPPVVAMVLVAGCGSDSTTATKSVADSGAASTTLADSGDQGPSTSVTAKKAGTAAADAGSPAITVDNVCSFIDRSAAETATGVAGLTSSSSKLEDLGSIICKLAAPGDPADAYGTVMFIALTESGYSDTSLEGLPGGKVKDPDPAGASLPPTAGRSQTTVSWTYQGKIVEVNGRGPSVTDASMLALAKAINEKLHA